MSRLAVYAGSFDPPTRGHEDIILRAADMFDNVIVAIGTNSGKKPLFTVEERLSMLHNLKLPDNVQVGQFDGLLAHYCQRAGAVIVRGLRATMDFEYEMQIAHANLRLGVMTVFLPTRAEQSFISSSIVKELARHGGDITGYVSEAIRLAVTAKF